MRFWHFPILPYPLRRSAIYGRPYSSFPMGMAITFRVLPFSWYAAVWLSRPTFAYAPIHNGTQFPICLGRHHKCVGTLHGSICKNRRMTNRCSQPQCLTTHKCLLTFFFGICAILWGLALGIAHHGIAPIGHIICTDAVSKIHQ